MTQQEMLDSMGVSQQEFVDFVTKFQLFSDSLNPAQLALLQQALPTLCDIAQSFGPNCSEADVEALLQLAPPNHGITCICWMATNPPN